MTSKYDTKDAADAAADDATNEADLETFLAMDIDRDFNSWSDFRNSFRTRGSSTSTSTAKWSHSLISIGEKVGGDDDIPKCDQGASELTESERSDINGWNRRLGKKEVFSRFYFPQKWELREMESIVKFLGLDDSCTSSPKTLLASTKTGRTLSKTGLSSFKRIASETSVPNTVTQQAVSSIFFPGDHDAKSVLLKRGPVLYGTSVEKELFLFTHGVVLAKVEFRSLMKLLLDMGDKQPKELTTSELHARFKSIDTDGSGCLDVAELFEVFKGMGVPVTMLALNEIMEKFDVNVDGTIGFEEFESIFHSLRPPNDEVPEKSSWANTFGKTIKKIKNSVDSSDNIKRLLTCAMPMSMIDRVESLHICSSKETSVYAHSSIADSSIALFLKGAAEPLILSLSKPAQREAWVEAFRICVVKEALLRPQDGDDAEDRGIGWQHRRIRASVFSLVVCNDVECLQNAMKNPSLGVVIDERDEYNSYTALHYAVILDRMECIFLLLQNGADTQIKDDDGRTPMEHAVLSKNETIIPILEEYGAKREDGERTMLFREARQEMAESKNSKKVAATKANKVNSDAASASGAMSDAMAAMRERGEKLERLDGKTSDLHNEASNYADMAKQLKEKNKKKSNFLGW